MTEVSTGGLVPRALPSGPISSTRAVERAMDLLAQVCDQGEIGLAECARRAGLAPSTALRLLRTLETSSLVSRDERGLFRAGPRLIQLGAAALSRQALVGASEPGLHRIVQGCGESTYLCLPGPADTAVYAGMVEGLHSVRHTSWIGRSIPLRGTAAGAAFRGEVPAVGYVVMRSAVEPDVTAIAAPVRRPAPHGGTRTDAIAAISVVGPTYRIDDEQAARIGALVSLEARNLSQQFAVPTAERANRATGASMAVSG